jgi:hypothetical protein
MTEVTLEVLGRLMERNLTEQAALCGPICGRSAPSPLLCRSRAGGWNGESRSCVTILS